MLIVYCVCVWVCVCVCVCVCMCVCLCVSVCVYMCVSPLTNAIMDVSLVLTCLEMLKLNCEDLNFL